MHANQPAAVVTPDAGGQLEIQAGQAGARQVGARRLDKAVNGLRTTQPDFSAAQSMTRLQACFISLLSCAGFAVWLAAPDVAGRLGLSLLALAFVPVTLIRFMALWQLVRANTAPPAHATAAIPESELAPYTLLVPLYLEGSVAAGLVRAMSALDYPPSQLEILFLTEADDDATRAALNAAGLGRHMQIVTVPDGAPRTKPRALNYGLTFARGEFVGIYDAEDVPDPGQLRAAAAAFRSAGPETACVQARLSIYNPGRNFLTRQFTLEYAALFDGILPALDRLGLPLPLGGTSNHFRRRDLENAGAWDPFNVTEDADLGVRLARLQKRVAMLDSVTWEEAPDTLRSWLAQRTRWIKGWMQTYLVHMRDPANLWRELGTRRFIGFQLIFGGLILSALAHPFFYAAMVTGLIDGTFLKLPVGGPDAALLWICCFNAAAGFASSIALVAMAVARRGGRLLARSALGLPLYWLAISLASYRALVEIATRPHFWAKTPHKGLGRDALEWPNRRGNAAGV